jgi:hypothetical protein
LTSLIGPFLSEGGFRFALATYTGRDYTLECSPTVTPANGLTLRTVSGNGTYVLFEDSDAGAPQQLYRVGVAAGR